MRPGFGRGVLSFLAVILFIAAAGLCTRRRWLMTRPDQQAARSQKLAALDKLIHEPGRLAIMSFLFVVEEADFLFLLDQTQWTRGNLSSHIAKLENAGHVAVSTEFVDKVPRTTYRLTDQGRQAFTDYRRGLLESLGPGPAI